ncbi:MAG: hypothetical protein KBB01_00470 [Candidatus Omnitrophica bacterium]|jgi:hypothetical protein|nr:hypothetical protein [Candidatus Omnitrophota bacterium]
MVKKIILVIFCLVSFKALAEVANLPYYPNSKLIKKEIKKFAEVDRESVIYHYTSNSSKSQISQFYKERLSKQGWQPIDKASPNSYLKKGMMLSLNFMPSLNKKETSYSVITGDLTKGNDNKACPPEGCFTPDKKPSFKPPYPSSAELISYNSFTKGIHYFAYKTKENPKQVEDFYLRRMPSLGWKLSEQKSNFDTVDISSACPVCPEISGEQSKNIAETPFANAKNLVFKNNNQAYYIFISSYYLKDIKSEAEKELLKDTYTIIGIYYHANK